MRDALAKSRPRYMRCGSQCSALRFVRLYSVPPRMLLVPVGDDAVVPLPPPLFFDEQAVAIIATATPTTIPFLEMLTTQPLYSAFTQPRAGTRRHNTCSDHRRAYELPASSAKFLEEVTASFCDPTVSGLRHRRS